jgi:hypothetical protein
MPARVGVPQVLHLVQSLAAEVHDKIRYATELEAPVAAREAAREQVPQPEVVG